MVDVMKAISKIAPHIPIERGTNYIKYIDGTLICYESVTFDTHATTLQTYMYTANVIQNHAFPIAFVERPFLISNIGGGDGYGIQAVVQFDASKIIMVHAGRPNNANIYVNTFHYLAIGKWK